MPSSGYAVLPPGKRIRKEGAGKEGAAKAAAARSAAANIGYPAEPEEIDWFMAMLRKGAPAMTIGESAAVEQWLRKNKPEHAR